MRSLLRILPACALAALLAGCLNDSDTPDRSDQTVSFFPEPGHVYGYHREDFSSGGTDSACSQVIRHWLLESESAHENKVYQVEVRRVCSRSKPYAQADTTTPISEAYAVIHTSNGGVFTYDTSTGIAGGSPRWPYAMGLIPRSQTRQVLFREDSIAQLEAYPGAIFLEGVGWVSRSQSNRQGTHGLPYGFSEKLVRIDDFVVTGF